MNAGGWGDSLRAYWRGPALEGNARRTYRLHLTYALCDATAGGILLNAPLVAIKAFEASNWQLYLRELLAGVGMVAALYLGARMATRRKMPFVFIPGVLAACCTLSMSAAVGSPFWFLLLFGLGAMCEIVTRPAITTILRFNYPPERRGHATGEVRKWSSLAFMVSNLVSAAALHVAARWPAAMVPLLVEPDGGPTEGYGSAALRAALLALNWTAQHIVPLSLAAAGLIGLTGLLCFRRIEVEEGPVDHEAASLGIGQALRGVVRVFASNGRYRRYLVGCFLDGFFQMLYFSVIWKLLSDSLHYGYVGCTVLMHALPALLAFALTGALGRWVDRSNPWISWGWIRLAWGADALLLAAAPLVALQLPPPYALAAVVALPVLGRLLRGSVQGVWWILWWQIGVTHFAPPGESTSRYMGIMVFLNGATRALASAVGMVLAARHVAPQTLIFMGGLGVVAAGLYSFYQARRDRLEAQPETIAEFERRFPAAQF